MKKLLLLLTVISLPGLAFGQQDGGFWEEPRRMAVMMNPTPILTAVGNQGFGIDLGFEYAITPSVSTKLSVRYHNALSRWHEEAIRVWKLRTNLEGRLYPQGNYLKRWFLSGNLQFVTAPISAHGSSSPIEPDTSLAAAVSFYPGAGYKLVFRNRQRTAFALEVSAEIGMPIVSGFPRDRNGQVPADSAVFTSGPRLNFQFGVVF